MGKTGGIIVYALMVILVLGGVIGGVIYLTNGGTTSVRTFNVLLNGGLIDNQTISMRDDNTPVVFNIESLLTDKAPSVKVRAVPNANADTVNVTVGGSVYRLSDCKDITGLFNIEEVDGAIAISSKFDFSTFLTKYFVSESNAVVSGMTEDSYITLIFTAGKTEIKCDIIKHTTVMNVELDTESIVIGG